MTKEEKLKQECTHNCMTCGVGCSEHGGDGVGTLEKTLNAISEIDTEETAPGIRRNEPEHVSVMPVGELPAFYCIIV